MAVDNPVSPEQLLEQARAGNRSALDDLLSLYRNYLAILARVHIDTTLQAKADPSDLAQEACLQAARDFPQFRGSTEAEFTAWLRKILANRGIAMIRHFKGAQRRDVMREEQIEAGIDLSAQALARVPVSPRYSPSQSAARREMAVLLADALATLPSHYRDALVLHHLERRPLAEVAARMGRSVDSVKKILARGLIRLRTVMEDEP
jgi:RNA polymerase sigma-70 factor (ECF subfamily)